MVGADGTFVIAENGNFSVTVIIKLNLLRDAKVCILELPKEG